MLLDQIIVLLGRTIKGMARSDITDQKTLNYGFPIKLDQNDEAGKGSCQKTGERNL